MTTNGWLNAVKYIINMNAKVSQKTSHSTNIMQINISGRASLMYTLQQL